MKWILSTDDIKGTDRQLVGGKGHVLARLSQNGFAIPRTVCVPSTVYREFVTQSGLKERILLEIYRKDFKEMRWEEIWDCATRIRNLFLKTPMPASMLQSLQQEIEIHFVEQAVAVRSSAPEEDDRQSSFAGLHESYLNIRGSHEILKHIRKVWASLWSDAALLYRQELGLDAEKSTMAVVVQEIVSGESSGVVFSKNPNDPTQVVIESVYGLNQGLVDGTVEPDRWIVDRTRGSVLAHTPADRKNRIIPTRENVRLSELPTRLSQKPPLNEQQVKAVFDLSLKAEIFFDAPQDVEWTFSDDRLFILQSRPVTTLAGEKTDDPRGWYLSLHRSFENLRQLRNRIENELIPAMIKDAAELGEIELSAFNDTELAVEIERRMSINQKWSNIYWEEFIPFAHGVRLFGQFYNDTMQPEDPYAFMDLLTKTEMASLQRNRMMAELAQQIRADRGLNQQLTNGQTEDLPRDFQKNVERFVQMYGDLSCAVTGGTACTQDVRPLYQILLEMARHPAVDYDGLGKKSVAQEKDFLDRFQGRRREEAVQMLELARTSYQLRDDDNIYLGKIEAHLLASAQEARRRLDVQDSPDEGSAGLKLLGQTLDALDHPHIPVESDTPVKTGSFEIKPRQLVGQPAGPGIAKGNARVVHHHLDLKNFKYGDILVCDAVDPNMTFVVPLAAAVVERRGGMLIHGAIIAREYGLPCVTGIPDATGLIKTGDTVTVDGYLGIVTVDTGKL